MQGGKGAPGLGFTNGTPNINGITEGSTLTISGNGNLESKGKSYAAGIGSGYSGYEVSGGQVSNIIINSGNIKAYNTDNLHGAGIGAALYGKVNNIVINGGNIYTKAGFYCPAIGGTSTVDNIIINGGNIQAYSGNYTTAIGSRSNTVSGTIKITGGNIYATGTNLKNYTYEAIGHGMENIIIEGGTIKTESTVNAGIFGVENNNINISGGNLLLGGVGNIGTLNSDKNFVNKIPINEGTNIYETKVKLKDTKENQKITKLNFSDDIAYGIKDMYTLEDGMLYLYLPLGERTINVECDGKTFSGTVQTVENGNVVTLQEVQ